MVLYSCSPSYLEPEIKRNMVKVSPSKKLARPYLSKMGRAVHACGSVVMPRTYLTLLNKCYLKVGLSFFH
jgi:hypothetical protein